MTYELLIKFVDQTFDERVKTKYQVIRKLEALGRDDFVEGVIDGLETPLTLDEKFTGMVEDGRFEDAPIVLFFECMEECVGLKGDIFLDFSSNVLMCVNLISDDSWRECWLDVFDPLETEKFFIVPFGCFLSQPADKFKIELIVRHEAFGTGQHATTRAIIRMLESIVTDWTPRSLLDIGTGTGIYLILAHHLGVSELVGTEISEDLAALALENCKNAGILAEIVVTENPQFQRKFDLIVANILAPILFDLMPYISQQISRGGRLIIAGFIAKEEGILIQRAEEFGFRLCHGIDELGWRCLCFELV
jgi:ribosomal protein L11 methylase PrmA